MSNQITLYEMEKTSSNTNHDSFDLCSSFVPCAGAGQRISILSDNERQLAVHNISEQREKSGGADK